MLAIEINKTKDGLTIVDTNHDETRMPRIRYQVLNRSSLTRMPELSTSDAWKNGFEWSRFSIRTLLPLTLNELGLVPYFLEDSVAKSWREVI